MNKVLTIEQLKKMSQEEIIEAYKNGYRLEEKIEKVGCKECENTVLELGTVSCPSSLPKGIAKTVTLSLTTAGTPPYTYKFYADGVLKHTSPSISDTTHSFSYTFDETAGSHTYKGEVTDSCPTGAKSDSSQCTITITVCPVPVLNMTIPS